MPRALRISFSDLPSRARPLSERETSRLFGGCQPFGEGCDTTHACCPGLACQPAPKVHRCVRPYSHHP
jgi:hypothetical protein